MAHDFPTIDLDGLPADVSEAESERVLTEGSGYREVLYTTRDGYPAGAYFDPEDEGER